MASAKNRFVEELRRNKFSIGASERNPLAEDYNEAIKQLSVALYQKDIHFISELIQNAEDNAYPPKAKPTLELVVTRNDLARVGASATLCLFNNEVGFSKDNIMAVCGVGASTKKGRRKSGYIGEKGIGFKSVFLVTQTPHIISNGYRIRFDDRPDPAAKLGYVVPVWSDYPTDDDLKNVYRSNNLPATVLVLPLRAEKVQVVQSQVQQIAPETILFIKHLTKISIRNQLNVGAEAEDFSITRQDGQWVQHSVQVQTCTTSLAVRRGTAAEQSEDYFLYQESFPIRKEHMVESRKDIDTGVVTLAFPCGERVVPSGCIQAGDIFAFLPTQLLTGFPFLINADFLLVASRETMQFDSPWNKGILAFVPGAFLRAFDLMLQASKSALAVEDAYRFIPSVKVKVPQLESVRMSIITELSRKEIILRSQNIGHFGNTLFCRPSNARRMTEKFRTILELANQSEENVLPSGLLSSGLYVVDWTVQRKYSSALNALGVPNMTPEEYVSCISSTGWVQRLSTKAYLYLLEYINVHLQEFCTSGDLYETPLIRYQQKAGDPVRLASLQDQNLGIQRIYTSAPDVEKWLSTWTHSFSLWTEVSFLPMDMVAAMRKLGSTKTREWLRNVAEVTEITIPEYTKQLILSAKSTSSPHLVLLLTGFLYSCLKAGHFKDVKDVLQKISPETIPVVDRQGIVRLSYDSTAQPQRNSLWPTLLVGDSWSSHVTMLSDDYFRPDKTNLPDLSSSDMMVFLADLLDAKDIPNLPIADLPLPGLPKTLQTRQAALLLLDWISCEAGRGNSSLPLTFLHSIQSSDWVETASHGWKRPTSCLLLDDQSLLLPSDAPTCSTFLEVTGRQRTRFKAALLALGMGDASPRGPGAQIVAQHLSELSLSSANHIDLGAATRLYLFLEKFQWDGSQKPVLTTVWVPPGKWVNVKEAVVSDRHGMFQDILPVLDGHYKSEILSTFFVDILQVPKVPIVDHYCLLWLRLTGRYSPPVKLIVVERVWEAITSGWASCDKTMWNRFLHEGQVPFVPAGDTAGEFMDLAPAPATFWADNLQVVHAFATDCSEAVRPKMVWIPKSYSTLPLHELYRVYMDMGVRNISSRVKSEIICTSGANASFSTPIHKGQGLVSKGLLRAVLAFLCQPEHKIPVYQRQQMVKSLAEVSEYEISHPYQLKHVLQVGKGKEAVSVQEQMVHWESHLNSAKLTYLEKEQRNETNLTSRLTFGSQLAKAIAYGVVGEYPHVAGKLQDFLLLLHHSGDFQDEAVTYWLRQRNLGILEEDEQFLLQVMPLYNC